MSFLPQLVDVQNYNAFEAKLVASVHWLITRVFDREIPDKLRQIVQLDGENRVVLSVAVQTALTNGSLYGQAAARIFKDGAMLQHRLESILVALTHAGSPVSYRAGGSRMVQVTEAMLHSAEPFDQMAHIAMMDGLMGVYVRRTCTIERAIEAVSRYTTICLLIRDDVEKSGTPLKGGSDGASGVIPEMEDLYEDLCDGCCAAALTAFYAPQKLDLTEICFNDPMSMTDCQYNLLLLQRFCDSLPINPWHFSTEDVLYMHESMQVNVNAFLTDLFDIFEPARTDSMEAPSSASLTTATTSSPRRFVPISAIPDLRAANSAARPAHPPKTNRFGVGGGSLTGPRPPRSMSVMSADSLAGARPSLPLSARLQQEQQWGGAVTGFGQQPQHDPAAAAANGHAMSSFAAPGASPIHSTTVTTSSPYSRSDSLPAASMSIRLALEEKRREHQLKKVLASTATEAERQETSKAAFFALMSKHVKDGQKVPSSVAAADDHQHEMVDTLSRQVHDLQAKLDQMSMEREVERLTRATSQPSIYHEVNSGSQSARPFSNSGGAAAIAACHFAQFHQMRPSLSNGVLNYLPPQGMGMQQMGGGMEAYGGQHNQMHQSAHAAFSLHSTPVHQPLQQVQPPRPPSTGPLQQPMQQLPNSMSYPTQIAPPPQYNEAMAMQQQQAQQMMTPPPVAAPPPAAAAAEGGFRLHQATTPVSRLDPPLELNRNLTNWGLTYRQGQRARRTWENETFVKSEHDLVNQPENVPYAEESHQLQQQQPAPVSAVLARAARTSREDTPASGVSGGGGGTTGGKMGGSESEGPPRDPTASSNGDEVSGGRRTPSSIIGGGGGVTGDTGGGTGFVVEADDAAAQDFDNMRMQAKRDALLAKTMKRKEEITQKVDTIEARNAERRAAERAKQEMADQRKVEKEIQRQKILDEYKRKKVEKELGMDSARSVSSVGRGSSQPPFARTKSQGLSETPRLPSSGVASGSGTLGRARGQSNVDEARRIAVPSCAEPALKLFAKPVAKSNRNLITNALQFSVFPGAVSADARNKVLGELAKSGAKHVLLLFRDHKCQYRGLYEWDQVSDSVSRIDGKGPKLISEQMMQMMFKYESGGKVFNHIPTKHLSATIDGFTIKDEYWQKPKIPHSGVPPLSHRQN
ncbi:ptrn-1 [Pristionchus pacificus]|uniref:Ptrn-1 n=1 Tax=Pristionchus pacificus TaxID=54126 RepID=A0A2A6CFG9_PRIPA|nr:ptrn-1 [Pristionchus pacificus]|eukprot:PDM76869.1 ptrn-1 [Pristionchus pacificus]